MIPAPIVAGRAARRRYTGVGACVGAVVAAVSTRHWAPAAVALFPSSVCGVVEVNTAPTLADRTSPSVPATAVSANAWISQTRASRPAGVRNCATHAAAAPDAFATAQE